MFSFPPRIPLPMGHGNIPKTTGTETRFKKPIGHSGKNARPAQGGPAAGCLI
jgi:hypothetical protein